MSRGRTLRSGRIVPYLDSTEQLLEPVNVSSLCFHDAAMKLANNDITEDEYLQALLLHCHGIRHGTNRLCNNDELPKPGFFKSGFADNLSNIDKFASSIAHWISEDVCKSDTRTIANTTAVFQVLKAYRCDDVAAFNAGLAGMDHVYGALGDSESLSRPLCRRLATLIVREQKEKIEMLQSILENCHTNMGINYEIGYHHVKKDKRNPDLLQVIDASGFKSRVPHGMSGQKALNWLAKDMMFD